MARTQTKNPEAPGAPAAAPWHFYMVRLRFITPFASSIPKNPEEIWAMLEHRKASDSAFRKATAAGDVTPLVDLAEEVIAEAQATEDAERGWATFKKDERGLYYEGRCVKGHLKDCATQVSRQLSMTAFKAKLANQVYVFPEKIYVADAAGAVRQQPDSSEVRFVHAMTPAGMRSSLKRIEYVNDARLTFNLKVFTVKTDQITLELLDRVFDYGATHGMGQERSQGWGQYEYEILPVPVGMKAKA